LSLSSQKYGFGIRDPRSGIRKKPIPDPGSSGQNGTGSWIRIRNTSLTNSGNFTGSHIRISNSGGTSKRIGNLNSAFEKADSQSCACDFEKYGKYRNPLQNLLKFSPSSPAYGTIYRIAGGFLNAAKSILKRVSVRIFKISKSFHRSKQKLEIPISP
jgi:hypothetical protein